MYEASDPRSKLPGGAAQLNEPIAETQYLHLIEGEPSALTAVGSPTWVARGQNFVVALTDLRAGDSVARPAGQSEYFVILHDSDASVRLDSGSKQSRVDGRSIAILPTGGSVVTAIAPTQVVRVFDIHADDVVRMAQNRASYAVPDARIIPLGAPESVLLERDIRTWAVDAIAPEAGRFERLFRSDTLMINYFFPVVGPRDPQRLSPHHHDDFEQGSLALSGTFDHHIRTPWGMDMGQWREDEHRSVGSPSLTIIPPPTIHTTRATGEGSNQLIDIFSPPRADFLNQPGWVINQDEYPTSGELRDWSQS